LIALASWPNAASATTSATKVSAGYDQTCLISVGGAAYCTGLNYWAQLGDGTTIDRNTPGLVRGLESGTTDISVGRWHTCAIQNGAAKCWGSSYYGELGDGTAISERTTPYSVPALASGVKQIGAGAGNSCALLDSGSIKCWGAGSSGQLGDGGTANSPTPVTVSGITNAISIAVGGNWACALTSAGGVKCWGKGGTLGNGSSADSSTPVDVTGLTSGVGQIAASSGGGHTCALTTTGAAKCWGANASGQLGNGTAVASTTPVSVSSAAGGATSISVGSTSSCLINSAGSTRCWGDNYYGQLGNGTTTPRTTPGTITGLSRGRQVSVGRNFACTTDVYGGVQCWGRQDAGELGNGVTSEEPALAPVAMTGFASNAGATKVSAGYDQTCLISVGGAAYCTGLNYWAQLGDGTTIDRNTPGLVRGLESGTTDISVGRAHTCAVQNGGAKCWGSSSFGELGDGNASSERTSPYSIPTLASGVKQIGAGASNSCALLDSGSIKCWGAGSSGQLGDGGTANSLAPVTVSGITNATSIAVGGNWACALTSTGGVKCWGKGGTLGNGSSADSSTPVDVTGLTSGVGQIAASVGGGHSCALTTTGAAKCWGANASGQLGNGTTVASTTPVSVSSAAGGATSISVGSSSSCLINSAGSTRCWGDNIFGQLGNGTTTPRTTPGTITGLSRGRQVSVGRNFACTTDVYGGVQCWGRQDAGELGNGVTSEEPALAPVAMTGFN
jgi:alpha-tubulin suppressor-like RCC1 family protein